MGRLICTGRGMSSELPPTCTPLHQVTIWILHTGRVCAAAWATLPSSWLRCTSRPVWWPRAMEYALFAEASDSMADQRRKQVADSASLQAQQACVPATAGADMEGGQNEQSFLENRRATKNLTTCLRIFQMSPLVGISGCVCARPWRLLGTGASFSHHASAILDHLGVCVPALSCCVNSLDRDCSGPA